MSTELITELTVIDVAVLTYVVLYAFQVGSWRAWHNKWLQMHQERFFNLNKVEDLQYEEHLMSIKRSRVSAALAGGIEEFGVYDAKRLEYDRMAIDSNIAVLNASNVVKDIQSKLDLLNDGLDQAKRELVELKKEPV